jgi:hypothetical protein
VTALTVPLVAFCAKAARICARLAAFDTKALAVDVMDDRDRRNETSLIVVAHIAGAANTADEIATTNYPTLWTSCIASHPCYLYARPEVGARAAAGCSATARNLP